MNMYLGSPIIRGAKLQESSDIIIYTPSKKQLIWAEFTLGTTGLLPRNKLKFFILPLSQSSKWSHKPNGAPKSHLHQKLRKKKKELKKQLKQLKRKNKLSVMTRESSVIWAEFTLGELGANVVSAPQQRPTPNAVFFKDEKVIMSKNLTWSFDLFSWIRSMSV